MFIHEKLSVSHAEEVGASHPLLPLGHMLVQVAFHYSGLCLLEFLGLVGLGDAGHRD